MHALAGNLEEPLEKLERLPFQSSMSSGGPIAEGLALLVSGRPREAHDKASRATSRYESVGASKSHGGHSSWSPRSLLELGRPAEAAEKLPPPSPGNEVQDIVYDTSTRVGIALALGQVEAAAELGRRVAAAEPVLIFRETVAAAVDALLAGGHLDEAETLLGRAKNAPRGLGAAGLDFAEGRILLAADRPTEARVHLERAMRAFDDAGLLLWAWRASVRGRSGGARGRSRRRERIFLVVRSRRPRGRRGPASGRGPGRRGPRRCRRRPARRRDRRVLAPPEPLSAGERFVTSVSPTCARVYAAGSSQRPGAGRSAATLHRWRRPKSGDATASSTSSPATR